MLHSSLDDLVKLINPLIFQEFEKNKNMTSSSLQSAVIEVSLIRSLVKFNLLKNTTLQNRLRILGIRFSALLCATIDSSKELLATGSGFLFFLSLRLFFHGIIINLRHLKARGKLRNLQFARCFKSGLPSGKL